MVGIAGNLARMAGKGPEEKGKVGFATVDHQVGRSHGVPEFREGTVRLLVRGKSMPGFLNQLVRCLVHRMEVLGVWIDKDFRLGGAYDIRYFSDMGGPLFGIGSLEIFVQAFAGRPHGFEAEAVAGVLQFYPTGVLSLGMAPQGDRVTEDPRLQLAAEDQREEPGYGFIIRVGGKNEDNGSV
jgi:hypothetical protein